MNNKKNILFTSTFITSFIRDDISLLSRTHTIVTVTTSGVKALASYLLLLATAEITFSWFASVYSSLLVLAGKLFRKKSILILGGVDVAKIPELHYGIWNSRWKSVIVGFGIRRANAVLAVDNSLRLDAMHLAHYDGRNIIVVPTGYDHRKWFSVPAAKEEFVLTVASCPTETRWKIKGIDFLLGVAAEMPATNFILAGVNSEIAKHHTVPGNLSILPFVSQDELLALYQRAKVYFQPSLREGLPNSLCEAMLCECYPVGTNVGGIPTAIDDTGSLVGYGNISDAVTAIRIGLRVNGSPKTRLRIMTEFSLEKRFEHLSTIINAL
ncbi:MAG: glycosyltransferase family 4 protein [Bacteroidota bacterium]